MCASVNSAIVNDVLRISWPELQWIANCTSDHWQARIGDPSLMGWITVFAYALTCALAIAVRRHLPRHPAGQRFFWSFLALMLAFLAVNKQLDLQSLATAAARCTAQLQGWYGERRGVQVTAILSLILLTGLYGLILLWIIRKAFWQNAVALSGLCAILAFVLVRAVGFHHVDALIGHSIVGIRMNWILELSGIALVAVNAAAHLLRIRRDRIT